MRHVQDGTPCDHCNEAIGLDRTKWGGLRWYYGEDGKVYHLICADDIKLAKTEVERDEARAEVEMLKAEVESQVAVNEQDRERFKALTFSMERQRTLDLAKIAQLQGQIARMQVFLKERGWILD